MINLGEPVYQELSLSYQTLMIGLAIIKEVDTPILLDPMSGLYEHYRRRWERFIHGRLQQDR